MSTINTRPHYFNVTSVTDREELASTFGAVTAWELTVTKLREREARASNRQDKMRARLALYNAEVQLHLAKINEGARR